MATEMSAETTLRTFLLSPASLSGIRGRAVLEERSSAPFLPALSGEGTPLGEVYAFISSLYFRGKLAYARRFAAAERVLVITPTRGLMSPDALVTLADLREFAGGSIDHDDAGYRHALRASGAALAARLPTGAEVVLLGSIASARYVEPLVELLGARLLVPETFAGR